MDLIRDVEPPVDAVPGWREQWRRAMDDCWSAAQMVVAFLAAALVFGPGAVPAGPIFTAPASRDATRADADAAASVEADRTPLVVTVDLRPAPAGEDAPPVR